MKSWATVIANRKTSFKKEEEENTVRETNYFVSIKGLSILFFYCNLKPFPPPCQSKIPFVGLIPAMP
jgi:hypothetical protein